jgi:hypothetical protein
VSIKTYQDLKTAINTDLNRDDLVDVVADYVEDAIKEAQRSFYYKTERLILVNTVVGQEFYSMPEELISILWLRLNLAGVWNPIRKVEYQQILGLADLVVPSRSVPSLWAPLGDQFRLYMAPDQIYSLELTGFERIGVPKDDDTSNFWTTAAAPMIRYSTLAQIYRVRIGNPQKAAECDASAEKFRVSLIRETISKTTQRVIAAHW